MILAIKERLQRVWSNLLCARICPFSKNIGKDTTTLVDENELMIFKPGISDNRSRDRTVSCFGRLVQQNREALELAKDSYVRKFTVHGLTKICRGNRLERFFWAAIVSSCAVLTIIFVHGLVQKYLRHAVFTELAFQTTRKNIFPSITFCESKRLIASYFQYCSMNDGTFDENLPCDVQSKALEKAIKKNHNSHKFKYIKQRLWSNGLFNITRCFSLGKKNCLYENYFRSRELLDDTCFTWNPHGDFYDVYGDIELQFTFDHHGKHQDETEIIVISHEAEIKELDITNRVIIEPYKMFNIKIDKTLIKRLPYPFPTRCTTEKDGDIFPGKYSRRGCIESYHFIDMYKKCGDTFDYVRKFIPNSIKEKYKRNLSIAAARECIYEAATSETKSSEACGFPCRELDFTISSTFYSRNIPQDGEPVYRVIIQLKRADLYHVIEEKVFFPWQQLACDIGGFLAVVTGASVISLVEIVVYLGISIIQKIY